MSRLHPALPLTALLLIGGFPVLAQARPSAVQAAKAAKTAKAAKAPAALPAPVRVTSVEGITEYRLANGLKVLLFPDPSKPNVTVNITYLVGSRNESYGETGMAHLLEHMLFKGTATHPDIPNELTLHGTRPNGTTSFDRTNYFESMKATDENLAWALDLEADRMINSWVGVKPELAAEKLKTEMTVVRNEMESGENDPMAVLQERVLETAYLWHNYGKPTIGARSDVENVNIWHLSEFFKKFYQPDNAVLLVAGRFDPASTLERINARFGAIPRPARKLEPTYTIEPTQDGERSVTVRRVGDQQVVLAGYHIPAGIDPDLAPLAVLGEVLSDAPSGRLYKALVETRKAAEVYAGPEAFREPGIFLAGAILRPDGNLDEARDLTLKTLEDVAAMTYTPQEVDRAKTGLLKQVELILNQTDHVGLALSEAIARGDWRTFFLDRDRLKAVTPEDVARVAKAYFKPSNRTLGLFIPTPRPDRAEIRPMPDVAPMVKDYQGQEVRSAGEVFDASPAAIEARTLRFSTPAGLKVAMVPKRTRGGSVNLTLALHFGSEPALMGLGARAGLAGAMLMRGTARHSRQELQDAFDKLKANVNISGGAEGARVSIETVQESLPEVLKLVVEVLREPAFPAAEFETLRQEELAGLEAQRSEPQALAGNALGRTLTLWPKGHPRHVETLEESIAELKAASLEEAKAFHAAFYGASNGELALVGALDPAATRALVEGLLGGWKSPAPYTHITSVYNPVPAQSLVLETPDKANAVVLGGMNLAIGEADPDLPALALGNFMLGGGFLNSRLATRIRVKEGLSYGVGSQLQAGSVDRVGAWTFFAICAPQNAAKVEAALRDELDKVLATGFTDKELAEAKSGWLQARELSRSQDRELAGRLVRDTEAGRTMAFQAELEKRAAGLTNAEVLAALKAHIVPANLTLVKAGDFKKPAAAK